MKRPLLTLAGVALAMSAPAQGAPEDRITITGDQELPSVLYVLPWRTPTLQPVLEPLLDNPALAPLGPCDTAPGIELLPGCAEEPANDRGNREQSP